jgi:hypothetical protein
VIWFLGYCAGIALTSGVILGANAWARELWRDEPFYFGDRDEDGPVVKNVAAMCVWPIAWVVFSVTSTFRAHARRHKRRLVAAEEYRRLLEAPLDGELIP